MDTIGASNQVNRRGELLDDDTSATSGCIQQQQHASDNLKYDGVCGAELDAAHFDHRRRRYSTTHSDSIETAPIEPLFESRLSAEALVCDWPRQPQLEPETTATTRGSREVSAVEVCQCLANQTADGRVETCLLVNCSADCLEELEELQQGEESEHQLNDESKWRKGNEFLSNQLGIGKLIRGFRQLYNYSNSKITVNRHSEQAAERLQRATNNRSDRFDVRREEVNLHQDYPNNIIRDVECRLSKSSQSPPSNDINTIKATETLEQNGKDDQRADEMMTRIIQKDELHEDDELNRIAIMSQQREKQNKYSSSRYEDRRSTYCSSIGALTTTDFNYDSSLSSSIHCAENCSNMNHNTNMRLQHLSSCPTELNECNDTTATTRSNKTSKNNKKQSAITTAANNNKSTATNRNLPSQQQQQSNNSMLNNNQRQQQQQCQITINEKRLIEKSSPSALARRDNNHGGPNDDGDDEDDENESSSSSSEGGDSRNQKNPIKKRENWDKNIEFLLAVIGFAVDLGNVWRFPYICYKNGGGAFLIPYTIMFILGGLPIFYLEMSLGQYFSSGCLTVWRRVCPMAKGIGYAMCVLNFFTGLYYNTIISWAVFFFVESFRYKLPWTSCDNQWNSPNCKTIEQRQETRQQSSMFSFEAATSSLFNSTAAATAEATLNNQTQKFSTPTKDYFEREVLQSHFSHGIEDLGSIRRPLAVYLAIVFICIYFAIWKGVKSTGKAVWITALLPYFVLIPLLVRGIFLEGAWLGIKYYLYPDWAKIIDVDVWVEAAKQIYFSLGPGFGTLMALSSYNKFNHNCRRDALIAAAVNYFASFISGLVIFAVLGYMATIESVSIEQVATEGPGLVFQVYPEGLATMQFSSMWSVLFFAMVITLGIDSTFGGLESVITGLCDEYPRVLRAHRGIFIGFLIILIYLCSLPTTTYGGNYVIYLLESYGTSLSLLFIVLIETITVCWLYGADKFCMNLEEMYGEMPGAYWRICWKYISPTILLLIFTAACGQELDKYHTLTDGDYTYPSWAPTIGLLMTGSSVCCVPIYAIYYIKTKTTGTPLERLKMAIKPIENDRQRKLKKGVPCSQEVMTDKIRDYDETRLDTDI